MSDIKMEKPDRIFKAGDFEVRMCHGLMCDFQRLVPDAASAVDYILNDSFVRDFLIRRALTDTRKSVENVEDLIDHELVELDTDEILDLVNWVAEHLLYFFVRSAENLSRMTSQISLPAEEPAATDPTPPSEDGSPD